MSSQCPHSVTDGWRQVNLIQVNKRFPCIFISKFKLVQVIQYEVDLIFEYHEMKLAWFPLR
jgi:hypothetical protein